MSFNKRFVDSKKVKDYLDNGRTLDSLFRADAFIFMDSLASDVYRWYDKGMSDDEIKVKFNQKYGEQSTQTANV